MSRVVAYMRNTQGSQYSLAFQRRIRLPFEMLHEWGRCLSFQVHNLGEDEELSEGMLMGPDLVLFQNFCPKGPEEARLFQEIALRLQQSGKPALWWYDLEDPALLTNQEILALLPRMRVVTVPTAYLAHELETFSRVALQQIAVLPSTYDLASFHQVLAEVQSQRAKEDTTFTIGCLGPHDWEHFLPPFVEAFVQETSSADQRRIRILSDSPAVLSLVARTLQAIGVKNGPFDEQLSMPTYLHSLAHCQVGLLPREGRDGRDICWQWEYGAMGIPTLVAAHSSYDTRNGKKPQGHLFLPFDQPAAWVKALLPFWEGEGTKTYRQFLGQIAFQDASQHRVAFATRHYAALFQQILPVFRSRA